MKRCALVLLWVVVFCAIAEAQTTIYWKRDHVYAGPGGGEIAIITPPTSDSTAPGAPSGLSVTSTTATSAALSWTGSSDTGGSGLAGYKVYRQKASGASLPVGTVNSSTTAFTDYGLPPNTSFTYTIVAFDNAQNHSSASGSASTTTSTSSGDTTAPTVPGGVSAALTGATSALIRWNPSVDVGGAGMKGYKVYQNNTLISGSSPITATSLAKTGLSYFATYSYNVEAVDNLDNVSAQSSTASVTTPRQVFFDDSRWTECSSNTGLDLQRKCGRAKRVRRSRSDSRDHNN
jgi:endoglucanase